jgi:hypothetical protein
VRAACERASQAAALAAAAHKVASWTYVFDRRRPLAEAAATPCRTPGAQAHPGDKGRHLPNTAAQWRGPFEMATEARARNPVPMAPIMAGKRLPCPPKWSARAAYWDWPSTGGRHPPASAQAPGRAP